MAMLHPRLESIHRTVTSTVFGAVALGKVHATSKPAGAVAVAGKSNNVVAARRPDVYPPKYAVRSLERLSFNA